MFDPWTSSFEEAREASEGWRIADPHNPIYQWSDAQAIEDLKPTIEAGNGFAILACIRKCLNRGLVAPEWLAFAFIRRYDAVLHLRAESWDDPLAFGRPYKKGKQMSRIRQDREGRFQVWGEIVRRLKHNPDTPIDKSLFSEVGKAFGLGATRAERLYYEGIKNLGLSNPANSRKLTGRHRIRR